MVVQCFCDQKKKTKRNEKKKRIDFLRCAGSYQLIFERKKKMFATQHCLQHPFILFDVITRGAFASNCFHFESVHQPFMWILKFPKMIFDQVTVKYILTIIYYSLHNVSRASFMQSILIDKENSQQHDIKPSLVGFVDDSMARALFSSFIFINARHANWVTF